MTTAFMPVVSPPSTVEVYEFSYSRSSGKMRFRLNGREWLGSSIACQEGGESLGVDAQGHWHIRCKLRLDGEDATVYLPADAELEACEQAGALPDTHWRLC